MKVIVFIFFFGPVVSLNICPLFLLKKEIKKTTLLVYIHYLRLHFTSVKIPACFILSTWDRDREFLKPPRHVSITSREIVNRISIKVWSHKPHTDIRLFGYTIDWLYDQLMYNRSVESTVLLHGPFFLSSSAGPLFKICLAWAPVLDPLSIGHIRDMFSMGHFMSCSVFLIFIICFAWTNIHKQQSTVPKTQIRMDNFIHAYLCSFVSFCWFVRLFDFVCTGGTGTVSHQFFLLGRICFPVCVYWSVLDCSRHND